MPKNLSSIRAGAWSGTISWFCSSRLLLLLLLQLLWLMLCILMCGAGNRIYRHFIRTIHNCTLLYIISMCTLWQGCTRWCRYIIRVCLMLCFPPIIGLMSDIFTIRCCSCCLTWGCSGCCCCCCCVVCIDIIFCCWLNCACCCCHGSHLFIFIANCWRRCFRVSGLL